MILDFFDDVVKNNYASATVPDYVFDVYVDKNDVLWLVDFNVWCWTDPLLFTWDELFDMKDATMGYSSSTNDHNKWPELRIVQNDIGVVGNPLSSYKAPIDVVDLASTSFLDFMQLCKKPSQLSHEI